MDIAETLKAYRLLLSLPYEAGVVKCLTINIGRFVSTRLRPMLADLKVSPLRVALEVEKPEVDSKEEHIQLGLVNVFLILYACPLVTDPLYFEVTCCLTPSFLL